MKAWGLVLAVSLVALTAGCAELDEAPEESTEVDGERTTPTAPNSSGANQSNATVDSTVVTNAPVQEQESVQEQENEQSQVVSVRVTASPDASSRVDGDDDDDDFSRVLVVVRERDSGQVLQQDIVNVHGNVTTHDLRVTTRGDDNLVVTTQTLDGEDVDVSVAGPEGLVVEEHAAGTLVTDSEDVDAEAEATKVERGAINTESETETTTDVEDSEGVEVESEAESETETEGDAGFFEENRTEVERTGA